MDWLSFLAPWRLWLLALPVALLAAYIWVQFRRRRYVVRFTNVDLLDSVAPKRPRWRRHLPAAVLLLGLAAGVLAFARPAVATEEATEGGVVVLAVDTSLSMQATDVSPSRIDAAKDAAQAFLDEVPGGVRVGVVGFDEGAREAISPTENLDAVQRTISRLELGQGTAIGEAIYSSIGAIENDLDRSGDSSESGGNDRAPIAGDGERPPAAVVLLSDGDTTAGRPNDEAAALAKELGIPVHTIAFGTDEGTVVAPDGQTVAVPVNKQALQEIARTTGGEYFPAASVEQLRQVYAELGKVTTTETVDREVTDWFALLAVALVAIAGLGSLVWFSRLP